MWHTKKILRWEIICLNEVYKFSVGHFLIRCIFYVLILNIEKQKIHFSTKICEKCIQKIEGEARVSSSSTKIRLEAKIDNFAFKNSNIISN